LTNHYDPNQPRVPVGHHDGGQWTGGGSGLLNAIVGPHGGDRRDETVRLAFLDGQKLSPPWLPLQKPAPGGLSKFGKFLPAIPPHVRAALTLYLLLSGLNDDEQQTIISFRLREFRRGETKDPFEFESVQTLTREEAKDVCGDHFEEVQKITDKAFDEAKKNKSLSPQQLGTEVHTRVENAINALKTSPKKTKYENLEAELSFAKEKNGNDRRGAEDTVRLDVFNRANENTICIDDIKTGRSGLSYSRMLELAKSVSNKNPNVKRIIVTEVRPTGMRPPRPRPPTLQRDLDLDSAEP
jgi:hypothetical protein